MVAEVSERKILAAECAYSAITRMELLGFPGITSAEDDLIRQKLERFTHVSLTSPIEDVVPILPWNIAEIKSRGIAE